MSSRRLSVAAEIPSDHKVVSGAIAIGGALTLWLWWHNTAAFPTSSIGDWLTNAGRVTGLLAGYVLGVVLVLMSRVPWLGGLPGHDGLLVYADGRRWATPGLCLRSRSQGPKTSRSPRATGRPRNGYDSCGP
jgi:hypothetical protein